MLKVEITDDTVEVKRGVSQKTQKPYEMFSQEGYIYTGDKYPRPFKFTIENERSPYPKGMYFIAPESLDVGRFGDLMFGRYLRLEPLNSVSTVKPAQVA